MKKVVNFVGFQAAWWVCILTAASGPWWAGPAAVAGVVVLHLVLNGRVRGELALVAGAVLLGLVLDGILASLGLLAFPDYTGPTVGPLPIWMLALWANLATTFGSSLGWMRRRWVVGALFGAIGGPLTYMAGSRFDALALATDPSHSLGALAVTWTVAMLLLMHATERCLPEDGTH